MTLSSLSFYTVANELDTTTCLTLMAVPEPGRAFLSLFGLMVAVLRRRRV